MALTTSSSAPDKTKRTTATHSTTPRKPWRALAILQRLNPPRCQLHSRKQVCKRACMTFCDRCKCVPPGIYGNREKCGKCYTSMSNHQQQSKAAPSNPSANPTNSTQHRHGQVPRRCHRLDHRQLQPPFTVKSQCNRWLLSTTQHRHANRILRQLKTITELHLRSACSPRTPMYHNSNEQWLYPLLIWPDHQCSISSKPSTVKICHSH